MHIGFVLVWVIVNIATVHTALVYYHHYLSYNRAYEVCRSTGMRLVRVDSEAKHQQLMDFTQGVENFTVISYLFRVSLKYDASNSTFINPDGEVNILNKWITSGPDDPGVNTCVVQHSGQTQKFGQWETIKCDQKKPFVCESGYPPDPDIGETLQYLYSFQSYQKADNGHSCSTSEISQSCVYIKHLEDTLIYMGFKADIIEICAVQCASDEFCTGISYTENLNPSSDNRFCILLKRPT